MSPGITSVDDSAATGGASLAGFVDEESLTAEIIRGNPNRQGPHPFRVYCEKVRADAGVPDTQETRQMTSVICGEVARLPFLPDGKDIVETRGEGENKKELTELDLQIEKTAKRAEEQLGSAMVWTSAARKLASAAIDLRRQDPDGKKGKAWVNDPLPGERVAKAA